jgi:nucleosome-remodeling factor subunit BPTF
MEPKAFKYLLQKQTDMEKAELASSLLGGSKDEESSSTAEGEAKDAKIGIEKKKLEQALKHARLERQVPTKDMFAEVVDISAALSNQTRILYPKVAKKGQVLDDFLQRRLQLKTLEERRIELKLGKANNQANQEKNVSSDCNKTENNVKKLEGESDTKTSITSDLAEKSASNKEPDSKKFVEITKRALWDVWIKKLKLEASKLSDRSKYHGLPCYSVTCKGEPGSECYSVTCPYRKILSPLVKEISEKVLPSMMSEAKKYGLDVTSIQLSPHESVAESINILQNFVKILMKTKDEADNLNVIGMSTVTTSTVSTTTTKSVTQVNGEVTATSSLTSTTTSVSNEKSDNSGNSVKTETSQTSVNAKSVTGKVEANIEATKKEAVINAKLGDMTRIYSSSDASGKLYLKRIQTVAESKKQSKIIRYPLAPSFYCPSRRKRNILNLAKHDAKRLARRCGTVTCEGFNYSSKSNNLVWPYPCPRPAFRTAWLYKTSSLNSIQAVAMQMRILWACIQWDDLQTKPTSIDGKHQETTETAIITTEIIKHKHTGRFQEFTEYFQRKVTIPLDMPKKQSSDNTPIRSGLRKRKREEAPVVWFF